MSREPSTQFWARTRRLTAALLVAWLLASLMSPWFAHELDGWQLMGVPLGYWLASQGSLLAFLAIVVVYAWRMDRMEDRYLRARAAEASAQDAGRG